MRHLPVALALTAIVSAPAAAQDLPTRKPGLWEMKMVPEGRNMPATSMRQCTDQATDKLMHANFGGAAQDVCPSATSSAPATPSPSTPPASSAAAR
jgi:hypothetical protein